MAMQIVDEPPSRRMTIPPLKEVDDFIIGQMVRENRAYDEVGASVRSNEKILEVSYAMGASGGVKFSGDFFDQGLRSMPVSSTLPALRKVVLPEGCPDPKVGSKRQIIFDTRPRSRHRSRV
jgi:hypothetical protein